MWILVQLNHTPYDIHWILLCSLFSIISESGLSVMTSPLRRQCGFRKNGGISSNRRINLWLTWWTYEQTESTEKGKFRCQSRKVWSNIWLSFKCNAGALFKKHLKLQHVGVKNIVFCNKTNYPMVTREELFSTIVATVVVIKCGQKWSKTMLKWH